MNSLLRALVDLRDRQIQKARIAFENRLRAIDQGVDDPAHSGQREIVEFYYEHLRTLEDCLDRDISKEVRIEPMFEQLTALKGIGPIYAAKLLSLIDINRPPTVSALWRHAGYGVIDGHREYSVKGKKRSFNKRLKTEIYNIGSKFLRHESPYAELYYKAREKYGDKAAYPDWSLTHQDRAARRKMMKIFLAHLWERWRMVEGLPTRAPYVQSHLGHTAIARPEDFGWPEWESDDRL